MTVSAGSHTLEVSHVTGDVHVITLAGPKPTAHASPADRGGATWGTALLPSPVSPSGAATARRH